MVLIISTVIFIDTLNLVNRQPGRPSCVRTWGDRDQFRKWISKAFTDRSVIYDRDWDLRTFRGA